MRHTSPFPGISKAGLALMLPALLLGISCSTPSKDKAENIQPGIGSFKASPGNTTGDWQNYASTSLPVTVGDSAYLKATFATTGGGAILNPGNIPIQTGQVITAGPITADTTYTVTAQDAKGHAVSQSLTILALPVPNPTITVAPAVITGATGLQASVANVAGSTYLWEITNGTITAGGTSATLTFTAGSTGTLHLQCTVRNASRTAHAELAGGADVTVNAHPPTGLSYSPSTVQAHVGVPLTPLSPTVGGGDAVQSFSVTPALPAGISLNTTTGVISGTPTTQTPSATYQISAINSGGSATFNLTLAVGAQPSASLLAGTPTIGLGGGTVLNWTVDASVDSITVDQGVQTTALDTTTVKTGAFPVSPTSTTAYTLTATLGGGGSFSLAPTTITVDATPFAITTFTTDAPQNVVLYGGGANLHWTLTGTPVALTLNGASVFGSLGTTAFPVRRQLYTLAGDNGLSGENTDSKTLTVAAQGLDLLAGHYSGPGYRDAQGANAQFNGPFATAMDAAGNLFVADTSSHVIRMMDTAGNVTTIAGVVGTTGTTDGALGTSLFNTPRGLAVTADGLTLFVADYNNHTIRKLTKSGSAWSTSTLTGNAGSFGANDGVPGLALFDNPSGLCLDSTTNPQYLYVADYYIGLIRQIDVASGSPTYGTTITYAGSTYGHVDVSNTYLGSAKFDNPAALCFGNVGGQAVIFVMDYYINTLRAVTYNGPATVKATATSGMTGSVYSIAGPAAPTTANTFGYADGTGTAAKFNNPTGLAIDAAGKLYIADSGNNCIRMVAVPTLGNGTGVVTTVAGSTLSGSQDAATGTSAGFKTPQGALVNGATLVVTDAGNGTLRSVDLSGGTFQTATLAGTPRVQGYVDATGANAKLFAPVGVAVDAAGNAYLADTSNHAIRKITPAGVVTLVAGTPGTSGNVDTAGGSPSFKSPQGIAVDKATGVIYVADTGNKSIRKIATDGTVTTLLATGFTNPYGLVVDPTNAAILWITDGSNKVLPLTISGGTGTLGTAVGSGTAGWADGAAASAKFRFSGFSGITADASGNLYVADRGSSCIRKLTKTSSYAVSTLAGQGTATAPATAYGFIDGALGTNKFNFPQGIDMDASGNLYVSEVGNHSVRKIDSSGTVTTIVGLGSTLKNPNGSPLRLGNTLGALPASLITPLSLALTPAGDLLVVTNDSVLQVTAPNGQ